MKTFTIAAALVVGVALARPQGAPADTPGAVEQSKICLPVCWPNEELCPLEFGEDTSDPNCKKCCRDADDEDNGDVDGGAMDDANGEAMGGAMGGANDGSDGGSDGDAGGDGDGDADGDASGGGN